MLKEKEIYIHLFFRSNFSWTKTLEGVKQPFQLAETLPDKYVSHLALPISADPACANGPDISPFRIVPPAPRLILDMALVLFKIKIGH